MKYYQKINLEYDKQQLIDIADKYMHLAQDGFTGHNGRYITYKSVAERDVSENHIIKSLYYKNLPENYRHLKIFTDLSNILKRNIDDVYNCAQYFIIEGSLAPHVDKRTAAFTIPLRGVDTPIVWYDESNNVLDKYLYEGPTLIDTKTKHGAEENLHQRLHFQIGGFTEPFSKIIENIQ
jgi:hypothetical protein